MVRPSLHTIHASKPNSWPKYLSNLGFWKCKVFMKVMRILLRWFYLLRAHLKQLLELTDSLHCRNCTINNQVGFCLKAKKQRHSPQRNPTLVVCAFMRATVNVVLYLAGCFHLHFAESSFLLHPLVSTLCLLSGKIMQLSVVYFVSCPLPAMTGWNTLEILQRSKKIREHD